MFGHQDKELQLNFGGADESFGDDYLREAIGSDLSIIRPEPRNLESLVSALFGEWVGDLSSIEKGPR
jgi:hypothetical protein